MFCFHICFLPFLLEFHYEDRPLFHKDLALIQLPNGFTLSASIQPLCLHRNFRMYEQSLSMTDCQYFNICFLRTWGKPERFYILPKLLLLSHFLHFFIFVPFPEFLSSNLNSFTLQDPCTPCTFSIYSTLIQIPFK